MHSIGHNIKSLWGTYYWHQKFTSQRQAYGKKNRRQKMRLIYVASLLSMCHGYSTASLSCLWLFVIILCWFLCLLICYLIRFISCGVTTVVSCSSLSNGGLMNWLLPGVPTENFTGGAKPFHLTLSQQHLLLLCCFSTFHIGITYFSILPFQGGTCVCMRPVAYYCCC